MDLGDPAVSISGMLIGAVGLGFFIYGKKQAEAGPLVAGLAMCIYPIFIASVLWLWLIFDSLITGLIALRKFVG